MSLQGDVCKVFYENRKVEDCPKCGRHHYIEMTHRHVPNCIVGKMFCRSCHYNADLENCVLCRFMAQQNPDYVHIQKSPDGGTFDKWYVDSITKFKRRIAVEKAMVLFS